MDSSSHRIVRSASRAFDLASLILLWLGALSLVFSLWLFAGRNFNTFPPAKVEKLIHGGANRPYSSRVLLPWIVDGALAPWSPETRARASESLASVPAVASLLRYFDSTPGAALEIFLVLLLDALSLLGFALVLRRLFRRLYAASPGAARAAPVAALLLLPLFFARGAHYPYDFPALFLFTAALACIHEDRGAPLYVVFALGTLNKETMAIALLAFYLHHRGRPERARWGRRLALLAGVVVLARLAAVVLSSPAGATGPANNYLRNYLLANVAELLRDPFLTSFTRTAALLVFGLLVFARWPERPLFLRRVAPVVLVFFALYLYGSQWGEIRALYEVFPILFLLGYPNLVGAVGLEIRDRERPGPSPPAADDTPSPWFSALALAAGVGMTAVAVLAAARAL